MKYEDIERIREEMEEFRINEIENQEDFGISYINNAFSLNMIDIDCKIEICHIDEKEFNEVKNDCISFVGHENTAMALGVPFHRGEFKLKKGDTLYVAQVTKLFGEAAKLSNSEFDFKYVKITIID